MCTTYHRHIGDTWYLVIPGSYELRNCSWLSSARYKRFYKSQRSYRVKFYEQQPKRKEAKYAPCFIRNGIAPLNATHGTATAMKLSKSWAFPLYFGSMAWFSSRLADRARGKIVLATAMILFEEPPPGYAVLWSVSVGAAVAPFATRWSSRFIASFVIVDSAQTAMDCLGDVGPVGTCHTRWINSPTSNNLPSISLAPNYECLLGDFCFFTNHMKLEVDS